MSSNKQQNDSNDDNKNNKDMKQKSVFPSPLPRRRATASTEQQPTFMSAEVYPHRGETFHSSSMPIMLPPLKQTLYQNNEKTRRSQSLTYEKPAPHTKPAWVVSKTVLKLLTEDFPLENTSRQIKNVEGSVVASRIVTCLSERSVQATYNSQKGKAKCTTMMNVSFRIQLFQTYEGHIVVEVQRRRGDGFRFMNECRAILDAAQGRPSTTSAYPRLGPITSMKCLENVIKKQNQSYTTDLEHAESMMSESSDDTLVLALEYVKDMSDPVKSSAGLVTAVSKQFTDTSASLCKRMLTLLKESATELSRAGDDNDAMAYKHQLILNILANVLTELQRSDSLQGICDSEEFEDIILPVIVHQIRGGKQNPHCAVFAIRCVTALASSPGAREQLLKEDILTYLQMAADIGSELHANLEREAERSLLRCC